MGQVSSISMASPGILGLDACTSIGSFSKQDEMALDLQNTLPSGSNSPDAIDTIAALLEDPQKGQKLYKALRNASKSVPPALFNAWAALADQAVRVGIDYRTLGLGWSHPNTRRQYRLGQHASISCPESRARAEKSRSFLHDVLMEALNKEAAYGAASMQSRLEEALAVAFVHEIGAPFDCKASASGILAALRTELLMPLRAINEGHIHRSQQVDSRGSWVIRGRKATAQAALDKTVGTLKRRAQVALGVGTGRLLDSSGFVVEGSVPMKNARVQNGDSLTLLRSTIQIQAAASAFAAILGDGSICTRYGAFAAILDDGSVVTWGNAEFGADSSAVETQLKNVQQIQASEGAFAAVLEDGSVVTWGNAEFGADSSAVQTQLKNVQQIQTCGDAFAAILGDGSVVTWGDLLGW
eukprot:s2930_g2.t1